MLGAYLDKRVASADKLIVALLIARADAVPHDETET